MTFSRVTVITFVSFQNEINDSPEMPSLKTNDCLIAARDLPLSSVIASTAA